MGSHDQWTVLSGCPVEAGENSYDIDSRLLQNKVQSTFPQLECCRTLNIFEQEKLSYQNYGIVPLIILESLQVQHHP